MIAKKDHSAPRTPHQHSLMLLGLPLSMMLLAAGCTHELQVTNIDPYTAVRIDPLESQKRIGISFDSDSGEQALFINDGIKNGLKDGAEHIGVFSKRNKDAFDILADISLTSRYEGSGNNFFISWPGFIVFAPTWHGYEYNIHHQFDVKLTDPSNGMVLDTFRVPVDLDIRHAAFKRTFWSEGMGWCGPGWAVQGICL